jgi:hypothetical protein
MRDVAGFAGVSAATVSRVVNNERYIRPETGASVERAIVELGFHRNEIGRTLRPGQSAETIACFLYGHRACDPPDAACIAVPHDALAQESQSRKARVSPSAMWAARSIAERTTPPPYRVSSVSDFGPILAVGAVKCSLLNPTGSVPRQARSTPGEVVDRGGPPNGRRLKANVIPVGRFINARLRTPFQRHGAMPSHDYTFGL